ncbi:MAG: DEAD/DEAH box helicase family protein [Bacillaceae bacterium]|nr:DEAD/DEAH box helicase family protein [Bacillaceae bacterium]
MLRAGEIVKGSLFPESVEIKKCECISENMYLVEALGRQSNQFFELMLDENEINTLERLCVHNEDKKELSARELQHFLQYHTLAIEQKYSSSRALGNKNLIPLPHQIEAVYSRMLQVPKVRFLLADDPGAGKTIMSGMLIRELKARRSAERILILVPPLVVKQWQEELKEKFSEDFTIISRATLKEAGGKNPFIENSCCIASMYWAARDEVKSYINEADFDLIIIDEAHKMAAYTHGVKNKKTKRTRLYQLGEMILRQTEHCLLLTATPHKGDMENFRHLMQLLDQDIFSNIGKTETLREKSNPFIIRRLKERMINFDGTPLFPKRTTKTITYRLSDAELELYEAVTAYVRDHFNRSMKNGSNSTAFAMMLLQRRLSSSLEAIHFSLERRRERLKMLLQQTEEERKRYIKELKALDIADYEDETLEIQQMYEDHLEQAVDETDPEELRAEINELDRLIEKSMRIKLNAVERKYEELEETLFGEYGLIKYGEKILIFTESTDTLRYLESKLLERVPQVAKIIGSFSMEERRQQVELFRNDCQIMLATDAGGESINLQFCNQLINYDIPWNPNKLEQRMGRIHRIGQKNEVFVFNLVASNTREGDVLIRLLDKMERMREDLGVDLVYDFIGEVLEDKYHDLASLMQEAILNRERLDEIIQGIDKTLSEEHKRLLDIVNQERLTDDFIDLPGMRREQYDRLVRRIPNRSFTPFVEHILDAKKVRIYHSSDEKVKRIDRLPKYIRDFARNKVPLKPTAESYRFTAYKEYEREDIELVTESHPLFSLAMLLTKHESEKVALHSYGVLYPTPEQLYVEVYCVSVVDGTGRELTNEMICFAKRVDGSVIALDSYWLFQCLLGGDTIKISTTEPSLRMNAVQAANVLRLQIKEKRQQQLDKKTQFLQRAFEEQLTNTMKKLAQYQADNEDNRNSALINQLNATVIDIEARRDERLAEIARGRNIIIKPPKCLIQLELIPNGKAIRHIPLDWLRIVEAYEHANGRRNVKAYNAFALVDFYSEKSSEDIRFIILAKVEDYGAFLSEDYLEDLRDIIEKTYIYIVKDGQIIEERALVEEVFIVNHRSLT